MKNYKQTASDVLRLVGGEKNVVQVEHCSTRLRFTLADTSKADAAALKKTAGVMGVISSGPQCQVVIGNDVIEVYDELLKLGTFNAGQAAAPAAPKGKKEIGGIILDYMVGIFQPLVPAIAGAGVLKALMVLLSTLGLMSSGDIAYKVFVGVADAALYYLPVMVAFTTATKFNCNKLVSVALAAAMIHPSVSALLATEGGAYFLGIKLQNIAYGGQVFPAILTVIFMSFIEKWANKWCPKAIRVFFVPMLCFGIGFPVALVVLGPLGYNIGALLTTVILALYNTLGWLAVALLAAVLPFMISMGMHKALVPYAVASISDPGFEMLYMPASLAHNISEGGACLGVALKTKDENLRATAISAGISGLFGITEPALYGVTLQHKKVMMSVVVSSFIGGLFVGLMKVKAFVAMGPGLAGMAMFVDPDNGKNILTNVSDYVVSWPGGATGDAWSLKPGDDYWDEVVDEIWDEYKDTIEEATGVEGLTQDDLESIVVTPYKISRSNGTKPDKHIDCIISVKSRKNFTARFNVRAPGEDDYSIRESREYQSGERVEETTADIEKELDIGGARYVFDGWYKELPGSVTDEPDPKKKVSQDEWEEGYEPTDEELENGVVNFYAHYVLADIDPDTGVETDFFGLPLMLCAGAAVLGCKNRKKEEDE